MFSHERWEVSIHSGADFNFPPSLWQDLTLHGGGIWIKQLDASVVIPEGSSHTCRTGTGQKPDIIDYFMVSACIRPLIQRCEVIKSVLWGPHYGVKLILNIDFESVLSRQLVGKNQQAQSLQGGCNTGRFGCRFVGRSRPITLGCSKTQV